MRLKLGQRDFSYAAPAAWNSLPPSLQQTTTTDSFKRHLKTSFYLVNVIHFVFIYVIDWLIDWLIDSSKALFSTVHYRSPLSGVIICSGLQRRRTKRDFFETLTCTAVKYWSVSCNYNAASAVNSSWRRHLRPVRALVGVLYGGHSSSFGEHHAMLIGIRPTDQSRDSTSSIVAAWLTTSVNAIAETEMEIMFLREKQTRQENANKGVTFSTEIRSNRDKEKAVKMWCSLSRLWEHVCSISVAITRKAFDDEIVLLF